MAKKKRIRFSENETFPNLFQLPHHQIITGGFQLKGNWNREFFRNEFPIVLELGCGKGEYTTGLARRIPDKNFIGMDIKGARMWRGLKTAHEEGYQNVAFIRTRIELIGHFFGKEEVDEIWITFPDPHPKSFKAKKRLTSPFFLERYRNILKKDHVIHLKTDNPSLFSYTLEVIEQGCHELLYRNPDIYQEGLIDYVTEIQTFYEKMWLEEGKKIGYLRFRLDSLPEKGTTASR